MFIKKYYSFDDLKNNSWGGAIPTIKRVEKAKKEKELMTFLEKIYFDSIPHAIQLNTFLQYSGDDICESLGILDNEEDGGA